MALDNKPLSITSMFNNIKSFFQSQENNSKWRDLATGAEGNFFMRMMANIISVISSRVVIGRREQFHDTASFLSSQIALAVNNGYPVFRGRNQRRRVRLTLDENINMTIPALSIVGFFDSDYSIVTLEEINPSKNDLESDKTIEFDVVIGALKEIEWQTKTSDLKKFIRHEQGISEDYMLYLDGSPVPTSKHVKDKINDKYYIYTNPYKSVTIEYLNNLSTATHKYDNDSVFTLRYIELADMDVEELTADMFTIGTLESDVLISTYKPFEGIEDIKHNSPVYREMQNLIRSKADWRDAYKDSLPAFKEVTYRALTPTYTQLSYIKDDHTLLKKEEEEYIQETIEPGRYFGRPFPDVEHSKREVTTLDITLGLINTYKYEEDIRADVQGIIDNIYKDTLNQSMNIYDIEQELKQLSYVKYARVAINITDRQSFSRYRKGDVINEKISYGEDDTINKTYICQDILGKSSEVEPTWFEKVTVDDSSEDIKVRLINNETGEEVESIIDNELEWRCYKRIANMRDVMPWAANSYYAVGDFVYSEVYPNYVFKCVTLRAKSDVTAPDVVEAEEGTFVEDGNLMLVCIAYNSSYPDRVSKGTYVLGDRFNSSGLSFEVIGFLGTTSGASSIKVKSQSHDLYTIPVDARDSVDEGPLYLDGDFRNYIKQGDLIQVSANLSKESAYEELTEDDLTLSAVIAAEVKEYEDDEEEDEGDDEVYDTVVNINSTVNVDLSNSLYNAYGLSSRTQPDVSGKNVGDFVADYQLLLQCIDYDSTLALRGNSKRYKARDKFNMVGITSMSFEVTTLVAAGLSAEAAPHIINKNIGDKVEDFQLLEALIPYNVEYEMWDAFTEYQVGTMLNVPDAVNASIEIVGITEAGNDISKAKGNSGSSSSEFIVTEDENPDKEDEDEDEKPVQNANWKELEAMKAKMEQIQEWIISEANDTLRNPADVLAFYASLGDGSRFTPEELVDIEECYNEYHAPDERQIYLHMDQFETTRQEAIEDLLSVGQLPEEPWLDKNCVKYYTSENELRYIDRYGSVTISEDGNMIFNKEYTPMATTFAIQREDADGNIVKIISITKNNEGNYVVRETYNKTFVTTVTNVVYGAYSNVYINRFLTRIDTTTPISFYMDGSSVNFAYNTTCDGRILWRELTDLENITYDWNVYPSVELNVDLKS